MGVPRLTAVPERANDTGVRCALRRFRSAHPDRRVSGAAATSCAHAACSAGAARAAQAVTLATHQSEGLGRVRGRVCLRIPAPAPVWVASVPAVPPGRVSSAASPRQRTCWPTGCWPTGWPSSCPASPTKTGTRPFRPPFAFPHGIVGPERPLAGKGEGVNTRSPLCRAKPSGRGVAPLHAPSGSCATADRAVKPQDVAAPADMRAGRCASPERQSVH